MTVLQTIGWQNFILGDFSTLPFENMAAPQLVCFLLQQRSLCRDRKSEQRERCAKEMIRQPFHLRSCGARSIVLSFL